MIPETNPILHNNRTSSKGSTRCVSRCSIGVSTRIMLCLCHLHFVLLNRRWCIFAEVGCTYHGCNRSGFYFELPTSTQRTEHCMQYQNNALPLIALFKDSALHTTIACQFGEPQSVLDPLQLQAPRSGSSAVQRLPDAWSLARRKIWDVGILRGDDLRHSMVATATQVSSQYLGRGI